ncbi:MAG: dihydrodipicolinate reductase [Pedosphaera sp.]|nr:dihydrodipicolinate reductase [Pedosphaera sp.]MST01283.1 dihydrodipicolinate reductase [Pedosphaera sp.]
MKVRIAQFGLGSIGVECLRLVAEKPWAELVGGVDIDPKKIGRPLGAIAGIALPETARVHGTFEELLRVARPDVVLHTAVSRFPQAVAQLEPIVRAGVNVVSSCEELIFPQLKAAAAAKAFDELCRKHNARVLGTGVNPGFVMDTLAICLTGVCRAVEKIEITRVVNASLRRLPLQKKIGSGLAPDEFRALFREGKIGHVGLVESLALVAHSLGWQIGPITETCEPVIATRDIQTKFITVTKGLTCGIHHRAEASADAKPISLDLQMYLDAENPRDAVTITADPPVESVIHGGVHGDRATVAVLVNSVPRLLQTAPGLRLMTDLPVPRVS